MYRKQEGYDGNDAEFDNGFKGMKCHCCPRRRVGGQMVNFVKVRKQRALVHQSVRPIKVGVVNDKREEYREHKVSNAVIMNILIYHRVLCHRSEKEHIA